MTLYISSSFEAQPAVLAKKLRSHNLFISTRDARNIILCLIILYLYIK